MLDKSNMHFYQKEGVDFIFNTPFCGLFMDMGLGKTVTTLTAIKKLLDDIDVSRVLIVAPKRVVETVWKEETLAWSHLSGLSVSKIVGSEKDRLAALKVKADIHIISRDNIAWLCGQFGGSMLPYDMLVIDESSSFKNPKSIRFKALKKVLPSFKRAVILTGTPASNGLIDLWPQIYVLDRGERLGKTITEYRKTYFTPGKTNGHIVLSYNCAKDDKEKIHNKISDICMSLSSKDYLNMPKAIINDVRIKMPKDIARQYEDFEREKVIELISGDITVANAAALSNKLLQFSNGSLYDENRGIHHIHDLKLDALEEIVESSGDNPILVAYLFRSDIDRIMERFKSLNPRLLKSDKDINDWNAKKVKMMLIHPASAGHGLNLQKGGHILVWFGLNWSLELYLQTNTRLDRQGQEEIVLIHRLICEDTIDQRVSDSLSSKNRTQSELLDAVKMIIKKYKDEIRSKV